MENSLTSMRQLNTIEVIARAPSAHNSLDRSSGATFGEATEDINQSPNLARRTNKPIMKTGGAILVISSSVFSLREPPLVSSLGAPFVFLLFPSRTPLTVLMSQALQVL